MVPNVGTPWTNSSVPSIGSRIHWNALSRRVGGYSSPMTPWSGNHRPDEFAETTLDGVVDVGDQRRVGLRLDLEIALDGGADDPACRVGQLDGDGMVALDISSRDPGGRTGFH